MVRPMHILAIVLLWRVSTMRIMCEAAPVLLCAKVVRNELVGIDINIDGTRCHRVIYVLEQARFIVSCEGRNLPILITS